MERDSKRNSPEDKGGGTGKESTGVFKREKCQLKNLKKRKRKIGQGDFWGRGRRAQKRPGVTEKGYVQKGAA